MSRKLLPGPITVALVAACAVAISSPAAEAALRSHLIVGTTSIAGYRLASGYTLARRLFGGPVSSTQTATLCQANWPGGLTIAWKRRQPSLDWRKACVTFSSAKMTGKSWKTDKGLRIGSSTSKLKKLYPSATHRANGGYVVWSLAASSKRALQAWVKGNTIRYFRVAGRQP